MLALRDQTGRLWVSIEDFLRRNAAWVLAHPRYFDIPYCPSAVVISRGNEVLFAGAAELGDTLGRPLERFRPAPDPPPGRLRGTDRAGAARERLKLSPGGSGSFVSFV